MSHNEPMTRRDLLKIIGYGAGASVMYQAMSTMGFAAGLSPAVKMDLKGAPKGTTILILGAGVAGLSAAYELRKAGYKVKILEFQNRPSGRAWSIYGGDRHTDTNGVTQACQFDQGMFLNAGAWRIPYHHQNVLNYCQELGVKLDPFVQINFNAYLHSEKGFGGKPQRYRDVFSDFNGQISELLAKATHANQLDQKISRQDKEILLEALKSHGALNNDYTYSKGIASSNRRGYAKTLGGGLSGGPITTQPLALKDILDSRIWQSMSYHFNHMFQQTMFEPRGGMEMIGRAFANQLKGVIQYHAEITDIKQSEQGVEVSYKDHSRGGQMRTESAQWCVCTIPLPMLRRMNLEVGPKLKTAIDTPAYDPTVKVGAQYKRRFWEQDEAIYGGMTLTDMPNTHIAYPCVADDYFSKGKGIVLNGYMSGPTGQTFTDMSLQERNRVALSYVAKVHPQAPQEFDNGYSTAWAKVPWIRGGYTQWTDTQREQHYRNLCDIDGRIVLAGEHASYMNGWLEGAITSSLDAITRLHQKIVQTR